MPRVLLSFLFIFLLQNLFAQPNFTANDQVPTYEEPFLLGTNPGFYNGWDDEGLADIVVGNPDFNLRGAGVRTQRVPLPDEFLEQWGVEVRVDEMEYYESVGLKEHVVFMEGPSDDHRDLVMHCADAPSALFGNMYEPIWINGEVNTENFYAKYVYDIVTHYGPFIKTYEVFNEPDFDYSGNGFKDFGEPGNWYENIPAPCDIKIRAPIYQYIRMLRITYEIVKTYDPESFVAVGGLGFPSFLDLILRHSDNPDQGNISTDYPLLGGAYFDMMSFHNYPHFGLRDFNSDINDFEYFRHSDEAVKEVVLHKLEFQDVLADYGYDGNTYPAKEYIITETNVPRVEFDEFIGSDAAQTNYLMKMQLACLENGIRQMHVFKTAESRPESNMSSPLHAMGFFKDLDDTPPYMQEENEAALGSAMMTSQLEGWQIEETLTTDLNLPDDIDGAVLENGKIVLWAKTSIDRSEEASANYSFPANWSTMMLRKNWDDFEHQGTEVSSQNILLNGRPSFFEEIFVIDGVKELNKNFSIYPSVINLGQSITLENESKSSLKIFDQLGHPSYKVEYSPGVQVVNWIPKVPGVYFVQVKTEATFFVEKILVL